MTVDELVDRICAAPDLVVSIYSKRGIKFYSGKYIDAPNELRNRLVYSYEITHVTEIDYCLYRDGMDIYII